MIKIRNIKLASKILFQNKNLVSLNKESFHKLFDY